MLLNAADNKINMKLHIHQHRRLAARFYLRNCSMVVWHFCNKSSNSDTWATCVVASSCSRIQRIFRSTVATASTDTSPPPPPPPSSPWPIWAVGGLKVALTLTFAFETSLFPGSSTLVVVVLGFFSTVVRVDVWTEQKIRFQNASQWHH